IERLNPHDQRGQRDALNDAGERQVSRGELLLQAPRDPLGSWWRCHPAGLLRWRRPPLGAARSLRPSRSLDHLHPARDAMHPSTSSPAAAAPWRRSSEPAHGSRERDTARAASLYASGAAAMCGTSASLDLWLVNRQPSGPAATDSDRARAEALG